MQQTMASFENHNLLVSSIISTPVHLLHTYFDKIHLRIILILSVVCLVNVLLGVDTNAGMEPFALSILPLIDIYYKWPAWPAHVLAI